ncbi:MULTISPECIES: hypothetical protein [Thermodesulfovibrio]|jgi:hypothetical protein|uniref:hypothetical protein n=1 Tax=Thermodesulfovibrio TaxID=28261 RepID=UPI00260DA198|nr:hypothetical protein [Thermodesulfovibrio sp.]
MRIKSFLISCLLILISLTGCAPKGGIFASNMDQALLPDGEVLESREAYIKALGLDKNPEKPDVVISIEPYYFDISASPSFIQPGKRGNLDVCVAKAMRNVIPTAVILFDGYDIQNKSHLKYKAVKIKIGGDALLVKRSELENSPFSSYFVEIHGQIKTLNKEIPFKTGTYQAGPLRVGNPIGLYDANCYFIANKIADVLIEEGVLTEDKIKRPNLSKEFEYILQTK